ncbi:MAG TPA: hypothetical protein VLA12_05030, partial [Planctomycetaceae bacterium]|nr:hypothetical protein [Planctomycetaceae bacterium]
VTNISADLSFSDSFTVTGNGGPKIVILETAFSSPIVQVTRQRTAVRAVQAGRARAIGAIPAGPNIMFPSLLVNEAVQDSITASTEGGKAIYERTWSYPYQSAQYFSGVPIARF